MTVRILIGDALERLKELPDESVHCCVTSPPYWGLRDYGVAGQLGLEPTPDLYVQHIVEVFREVRRVLRKDGTLWLNLGDSYAANRSYQVPDSKWIDVGNAQGSRIPDGLKPKDLIGIPWMVTFALRANGWWLRSDIIWSKPNPMPESVTDRPTSAHEHVFLLAKAERYYFDQEAVKEPAINAGRVVSYDGTQKNTDHFNPTYPGAKPRDITIAGGRNIRNVWTIATQPFPEAHFATFPPELAERCIKAGTSEKGCCAKCSAPWERITEKIDTGKRQKMADGWDTGPSGHGTIHRDGRERGETDLPVMAAITTGWQPSCVCRSSVIPCTVLDPFSGADTTGLVADRLGRNAMRMISDSGLCNIIEGQRR